MPTIDIQRQTEIFERAKKDLSDVLDSEMLSWDFKRMLAELRKTINEKKRPGCRNYIRWFARKYFGFQKSKFKDVTAWLNAKKDMSEDEIKLVLRTIRELRVGAPQTLPQKGQEGASDAQAMPFGRAAVENVMGQLNIARALLKSAGATPSHAYDGDRMIVRKNIKAICERLGIDVRFPKTRNSKDRPVTDQDLSLG